MGLKVLAFISHSTQSPFPLSFIGPKVLCHLCFQRLQCLLSTLHVFFTLQRLQCLLPLHFKDYQSRLSYRDFNVFCLYISKTIKVFCLAETSMSFAFTFQRLSMSFVKTSTSSLHFKDYKYLLSRLQHLFYISKIINVFCQDFNVFFTFQRLS